MRNREGCIDRLGGGGRPGKEGSWEKGEFVMAE